ncbi:hypothetical protein BU848_23250, partial [Salmonella enterica]|nr:hypothetical protein [Salmonella enterica]
SFFDICLFMCKKICIADILIFCSVAIFYAVFCMINRFLACCFLIFFGDIFLFALFVWYKRSQKCSFSKQTSVYNSRHKVCFLWKFSVTTPD